MRGDVFTECARGDIKISVGKQRKHLSRKKMDLTQIGLRRIGLDPRAVPHRGAAMGVTTHPESGDQFDLSAYGFTELMVRTGTDRNNGTARFWLHG